jgi:hypothetical protein
VITAVVTTSYFFRAGKNYAFSFLLKRKKKRKDPLTPERQRSPPYIPLEIERYPSPRKNKRKRKEITSKKTKRETLNERASGDGRVVT